MNHSFNTEVAEKYGVDEAIMLENIAFWINKNEANRKHFYDNDYWTYNSTRAFTELFPYWTERQIQRILKSLEEKNLVKTGNYNKVAYDRTKWYGLTQISKCIYAKRQMEIHENVNGITEKVEPIPDINTVINSNINKDIYTEIFNHYLSKENLIKHTKFTEPMKKGIDKVIKIYSLDLDYIKRIIDRHSEKVEQDKNKTEFKTTTRTLSELLGQKKYRSEDYICSDYFDEKYKKIEVKEKKQFTKQIGDYKIQSL